MSDLHVMMAEYEQMQAASSELYEKICDHLRSAAKFKVGEKVVLRGKTKAFVINIKVREFGGSWKVEYEFAAVTKAGNAHKSAREWFFGPESEIERVSA